jgi:8-oxo-dGTP diphosphatase
MQPASYQVFTSPPLDFSPKMHAAGCYLVAQERILILERHPDKFQGATWGVPGGKLEPGENPASAVVREVQEEVGIRLSLQQLQHLGSLYIRLPGLDYVFTIFSYYFSSTPSVELEMSEHTAFGWFLKAEARQLNLIQGGIEALAFFEALSKKI